MAARIPVEELRSRVEYWLRRIPRVYRIDWLRAEPYVARISMHREVYDEVVSRIREWGGEVRREIPTRPPMRVIEADFSRASPPAIPLAPEMERYILWGKFSAILSAAGVRPEDYREDFEATLRTLEGRPFEEKQRAIEKLAKGIIPPPAAPAIIPRELVDRLERIERRIEEISRAVAWRPRSAEEIRMIAEAMLTVPPKIVLRVDEAGHPFLGPDDETLQVLAAILDPDAVKWFMSCPGCRLTLPGGALSPTRFVDHLIRVEKTVPPMFVSWLRRFARMLEEAERRGVPP